MVNVFISASSQSCHDKLIELFSEKLYLIGLAALVVANIMVSVTVKMEIRPQKGHMWKMWNVKTMQVVVSTMFTSRDIILKYSSWS